MLISRENLRTLLLHVLHQRVAQGADLDEAGLQARIAAAAGSYDALAELAAELRDPPLRADWPWDEPVAWEAIVAACDRLAPDAPWPAPDFAAAAAAVRTGFLASVCGCLLGKPLEVDPTAAELRRAGEAVGEWPLRDYVSEAFLDALGRRHDSWPQTTRGNLRFAVADDDLHYTLLGMLVLEQRGAAFTHDDLYELWGRNLPHLWTWGPERTALLSLGVARHHLFTERAPEPPARHDVLWLNPGDELCGALIRADAYGCACPGHPDLAARLAWQDASFTHARTGVYGSMFVAALIATCLVADAGPPGNDRLDLVESALRRVPSRSRFAAAVREALDIVGAAPDWQAAGDEVCSRFGRHGHCQVFQEIAALVNTVKFAASADHGFCLQVSQGADTDSFGATAGMILGCLFGADGLDRRWLGPLAGELRHALADLHEFRLEALAARLGALAPAIHGAHGRGSTPGR